jgi:hypothetical protein
MTKTTLSEAFDIRVEPISTAPTPKCDCSEETKDKLRACPHTVDDILLVLPDSRYTIGYWGGERWASYEGEVIHPIGWARLPKLEAHLRAAA